MEEEEHNQRKAEADEEIEIVPEVVFARDSTDLDYVEIEEPGEGYRPTTSRAPRGLAIVIWALIFGGLGLVVLIIVLSIVLAVLGK